MQPLQVQPIAKKIEPEQMTSQIHSNEPNIPHGEPENMSTIPPFLLNALVDNEAGEVDMMVSMHDIEMLEKTSEFNNMPQDRKAIGVQTPYTRPHY